MSLEKLLFEELQTMRIEMHVLARALTLILRKQGVLMSDITNLSNEISGLVTDQTAFNAKVDADLAAIAAFIAQLQSQGSAPSQADLDALQAQVAGVRSSLQAEGTKVDSAVPSTPATPAV